MDKHGYQGPGNQEHTGTGITFTKWVLLCPPKGKIITKILNDRNKLF